MINVRLRDYTPELLDNDQVPFADIQQNMKELNIINSYLGGHSITINGLQKILRSSSKSKVVTICEIGCGGGDNLLAIARWCKSKKITANFIGIDIKPACIEFAKKQCTAITASWITNDYLKARFEDQPDIIFSSLFCHHFKEDELVTMLQWMKANATTGFFINDLHRHPLAYHSIQLLTALFSKSYLVKNDAPLSVARGFKRKEWIALLHRARITDYSLQWKWAFRYLITYCHAR